MSFEDSKYNDKWQGDYGSTFWANRLKASKTNMEDQVRLAALLHHLLEGIQDAGGVATINLLRHMTIEQFVTNFRHLGLILSCDFDSCQKYDK